MASTPTRMIVTAMMPINFGRRSVKDFIVHSPP
jgi:hypothetical protein